MTLQRKCPICFSKDSTPTTIGSWIVGDVMRGKRMPCLSCHTKLPDAYEYALRLIDDKNFLCREAIFWEDAHKFNKEQTVIDRMNNDYE